MSELQISLPFSDTVKVGNALIRSPIRFKSYISGQILAYVASCIKPNDEDFKDYKFPAKEILMDKEAGTEYYQLKKACSELLEYTIDLAKAKNQNIRHTQNERSEEFELTHLFSYIKYSRGFITARFDKELKPYYLQLKDQFTLYSRPQFFMLHSTYAQQLFRVLHSYRNLPYIQINLEDLHYYLNSAPTFRKAFKEFRRAVFEPACNEILSTGFAFTWEAVKIGRNKVIAIKFVFSGEHEQSAIQISQKTSFDVGTSKWNTLKEEFQGKGLSSVRKQGIMYKALFFMGYNETTLMEMIEMFSRNANHQMDFFNFIEKLIERYANCKNKTVELNGYIYAAFKSEFVN